MLVPSAKPEIIKNPKEKRVKKARAKFAKTKKEFYGTWEWRTLRMHALNYYGRKCMSCGETEKKLCVDHVKPLHTHWELRLEASNLQILCDACNMGKGIDQFDFRPPEAVAALNDILRNKK